MRKKFLLALYASLWGAPALFAQTGGGAATTTSQQAVTDYAQNSGQLNNAAAKLLSAIKDSSLVDFVRELNLNFQIFQAQNQPTGLGFSYKYDNSWTFLGKEHDFTQAVSLDLTGNVAFQKVYNPANFLESKAIYSANFFWGGFAAKVTPEQTEQLIKAGRDLIAAEKANDPAKIAEAQAEINDVYSVSDQFFISLNASPSYESNQDFSKQQFAPGAFAIFGANGYNNISTLGWYNLPDYPFALIRLLTGTDPKFHPSGASLPTALVGLDYVVPAKDSLRKAVTGELNPFSRLRFEAEFKTEAARVDGQAVYFTADYRWYNELNASTAIKAAGMAKFNYFVAALEASNGFFVSYSTGQLPFDQKSSQVYALGFKYNLGTW